MQVLGADARGTVEGLGSGTTGFATTLSLSPWNR